MKNTYKVELVHFHLYKKNTLVVQGYFPYDNQENYTLKVLVDKKEVPFDLRINGSNEVRRRYISKGQNVSKEYIIEIPLEGLAAYKELSIINEASGEAARTNGVAVVYCVSAKEVEKIKNQYTYKIDSSIIGDDSIRLVGWSANYDKETFHLYDGNKELLINVKRSFRKDVINVYQELAKDAETGFEISFKKDNYKKLKLILEVDGKRVDLALDTKKTLSGGNPCKDRPAIVRVFSKVKKDGLKNAIIKIKKTKQVETFSYMDFVRKNAISEESLEEQRHKRFDYNPLISIVIPMFNTPEKYLYELIDTIIGQTYSNWELCIGDGSPDERINNLITERYPDETRIAYYHLHDNLGISDNTNAVLEHANGEYIVLSDHDDTLAYNALFEIVKAINEDRELDVIYSDEDKISMEGDIYFDPSFKPDFNIDYLRSVNYICHLFVFKKDILAKAGHFNRDFDGAQDHDFILRCVEVANKVGHIPMVLYHWRCHIDSTAMNLESKLYALNNGARAVEEHYKRVGILAKVSLGEFYGTYKTSYNWHQQPLVSIIIPTKDHVDDLKKCINSIDNINTYRNIEIVIVENNSEEEATFDYYEELRPREDIRFVEYKGSFNFSAINNLGVSIAKGDYLLLLNNDTEIINGDCIKELLDYTMREDVGICGAKLFYPDNTIQHGGIVIGIGGIAGHTFVGLDKALPGYMYRASVTQDVSAVTAACLMIKKSVFTEVGGFTEELAVAFNDVDLCLKVRKAGYLVVYNPNAQLYHFESKSRGLENSAEKQSRFNGEIEKLEQLWPNIFDSCDMYYNPNLSLVDGMYRLKE